jgi:hypothetical protein
MNPVLHFMFHKRTPAETGHSIRTCCFPRNTWPTWPAKAIETTAVPKVTERVHAALLEEMTLEDRINDEVRVILEAYSEEMNKTGANYQEMFRKVKSELVRKYKAVL